MSTFDYAIIFITSICCLFSFYKGMVREIFSLLGYLVGYVLSIDYYEEVTSILQSMLSKEIMVRISEFSIVFTIVKILVAIFIFFTIKFSFDIVGRLIRRSVGGSIAISFPDRIGGGVLGILKGFVIVSIMMFPLSLFRGGYERVTQGSIITPYLEKVFSVASQESFSEKFLDLTSDMSVDSIQGKLKKMSDLNTITKDIEIKKDELLDNIKILTKKELKEEAMEKYTEEDKNKLNDILETFSNK
ncbi:MAG: CvpA family protein [Nitrospinaceae bacterium]|nr:CvpA family protein [Nitrospinaceae bacterium]